MRASVTIWRASEGEPHPQPLSGAERGARGVARTCGRALPSAAELPHLAALLGLRCRVRPRRGKTTTTHCARLFVVGVVPAHISQYRFAQFRSIGWSVSSRPLQADEFSGCSYKATFLQW